MNDVPEQSSRVARVLVVDDDPIARRMLCKALKREGFLVAAAGDGQQALAAYDQQQQVDIVLLDIEMPVMDGYTTCRELRKRASIRQLPILMVSGNCDTASANRAYDEGANDFITKPVSLAQLGTTLEKWLQPGTDPA